ncbi:MAG: immunity 53 family protein [Chthoniobacterales bacterium]
MTSAVTTNAMRRLQEWFHAQCDGEWEHGEAITIETLDNPGWTMKIALEDTRLSGRPFTEVKRDYDSATEWLTCFLRDGKFMGACGPLKLEEMVEVFLAWAEES